MSEYDENLHVSINPDSRLPVNGVVMRLRRALSTMRHLDETRERDADETTDELGFR
jgi:hypothetical protein